MASREPAFDAYAVLQVVPTAEPEVIHAAFRALALKYHPDRDPSRRAERRMGDLNRAYTLVRDEVSRAAYDRARRTQVISGVSVTTAGRPASGPPPASPSSGSVLGFGRYAGWGLRDLARHDPEYLIWLSRHSSGIRYRTEIYGILRTLGLPAA
jgi:curved DNA-binding protein CbpA